MGKRGITEDIINEFDIGVSLNDSSLSQLLKKKNFSENLLYDIGLVKGTKIKLLFLSPSKKIKAYLIRDSIIAIRDKDASKIKVCELND